MCGRRSAMSRSRYLSGLAVSKREALHPLSLAFIHVFPIYVVIHVEVLVAQRWQEYIHTTPEMKRKNRVIEITSHLRHSVITKTQKQTETRTVGKVPQYKILKFFSNIEGTWDMSE